MSCVEQGVAILGTVGTLWGSLLIFQDRVLELLKQRINSESFGESVRLAFVLCKLGPSSLVYICHIIKSS